MKIFGCMAMGVLAMSVAAGAQQTAPAAPAHKWALVVHGGAGVIDRSKLTPEADKAYRAGLQQAAEAGSKVLDAGGTALDAVEATLHVFEDNPLFNAGRGAVFSAEGKNEMDSSIMDGATLKAGAVAGVQTTRHPISLARAVMDKSPHVMLAGPGTDRFAQQIGLEQQPPSFFFTESRWQGLVKQLQEEGHPVPPRPAGVPPQGATVPVAQLHQIEESDRMHVWGTTGAVALDRAGNIAAGTSTGGMQGKMPGRVGDSPIIGAGTYASNQSCAVSGTGTGEYYIRLGLAREVCNLVYFRHMKLQAAADEVMQKELTPMGGDGGVIAIDPAGDMVWSLNTPGMFRARIHEGGKLEVHIYADEEK